MYALEEKLAAVELACSGMTYRQAGEACGIPHPSIWRWRRILDAAGGNPLCSCSGRRSRDEGAAREAG